MKKAMRHALWGDFLRCSPKDIQMRLSFGRHVKNLITLEHHMIFVPAWLALSISLLWGIEKLGL